MLSGSECDSSVKLLSHVWLFVTPWTVTCRDPLSMGFSRQEYWIVLPFPSPGDLPNPGIEPRSPALQTASLPSEPPGRCQGSSKILSKKQQLGSWRNWAVSVVVYSRGDWIFILNWPKSSACWNKNQYSSKNDNWMQRLYNILFKIFNIQ